MNRQIIPVVFATDENYVPYCGVAIISLIKNANPENMYEVYVLYDRIEYTSIKRLEGLSEPYVKVQCICIHEYIESLNVSEYGHLTIASAYRLVIPYILPQYKKVVYLDSDIVVNEDIANMYNVDIGDNILGAVHGVYLNEKDDFLYKHITETLKIDEKNFFNAGILVINNVCFVKEGVKDKCFKLLSTRKDLYFMDQCALNIICEGKVYYLDEKWNYESLRLYFVNEPEKLRIMENPAIVHYDGSIKPWNDVDMPLGEYFWKYARNSRFYETLMKKIAIKGAMEVLGTLGMVKKFRNIAVYGAGCVGKNYIDKVLALKICNIVVWVDKNYKDKGRTKIPVESPERLYETEFDHVVIAIEKKEIVEEVENMLCAKGIAKEKIIKLI